MTRAFAIAMVALGLFLPSLRAQPQTSSLVAPASAYPAQHIAISKSVVPLYGTWKFHVGDSPIDPATRKPVWAESAYNDSAWEDVDLTPDDTAGTDSEAVPGWTARGHAGYWGYAWYRIRLKLVITPEERLALAGPSDFDDAYQAFFNGTLLGSFGDFVGDHPVVYYSQPMMFPLPNATHGTPAEGSEVIAFRVWMEPNTIATSDNAGGFRSAPILGDADAIAALYQLRWLTLVRNYSPFLVNALLYGLLAMVAFSFLVFDRTDRVYLWMGGVFLLTAVYSGMDALDVWTRHLSILTDSLIIQCFLGPLAHAGWVFVWWIWFGRPRPAWTPIAACALSVVYMVSNAIAMELFFALIPHSIAASFEVVSLTVRTLFFFLLLWIVIQGIRRYKHEGWLVLPAIVLVGIGLFQTELAVEHIHLSWFPLGVRVVITQVASLLLAAVVALLLMRRLVISVRRQRMIELDARRSQLQSDFVSSVSHEFRSPLTTMRTITDLLAENRIADESRRAQSYAFMDRAITRLQRLVEDLLDFGQMESGRKQYTMEVCDAFYLTRSAIADFTELASAEGFEIETDLNGVGATIFADEEAFVRALRNLLENAMKYSPRCRTLWVTGDIGEHDVLISVRDQGIGIDESEQQVIFQKFVRGDAAKKAGIHGTGIGLALVQQILEALGGTITLESEPGVGSTFTLAFPLAGKAIHGSNHPGD